MWKLIKKSGKWSHSRWSAKHQNDSDLGLPPPSPFLSLSLQKCSVAMQHWIICIHLSHTSVSVSFLLPVTPINTIYNMIRLVFLSKSYNQNNISQWKKVPEQHRRCHLSLFFFLSFACSFRHSTHSHLVNSHDRTFFFFSYHQRWHLISKSNTKQWQPHSLTFSPSVSLLLQLFPKPPSLLFSVSFSLTEWINRLSKV